MKTLVILFITILAGINLAAGSTQESIESANKAGLSVFLVVTDPGNAETQKALNIANQAHEKYAKSEVIQMNRSDAANKDLVAKYGISGAPLPLILVVASNGVVTGGLTLNQATADLLVKLVPSPVKSDVLKALSAGKSVFLVVSSKNMEEKNEVMNTCAQACIEMQNNAKLIGLDLDDQNEKTFIAELKIDPAITSPQTFVINSKGQITGTFSDDVNTTSLVASAKKLPAAKGCCPSGSGAGCAPKK
jgi:competence protein ComGC